MKIAILGFGLEGESSYRYFDNSDAEVVIHDQNTALELPNGYKSVLGDSYLDNLNKYDLIMRTAGIAPSLVLEKNPGIESKLTSQLNEFLGKCPSKNVVGVTGTKGKGTTSTLITRMLEASGKTVHLAGNIGIALLDTLNNVQPEDYVVLELSSFQLIDLKVQSPHLAVCLMITPEHLNWHSDMDEYINAKAKLFSHQTEEDVAVYYSKNELSRQIASSGPGHLIPYFEKPGAEIIDGQIIIGDQVICAVSEVKLLGNHNLQNICAAATAFWQIEQNVEPIKAVATSFSGLPHRLEFILKVNGIDYYNDSFGTTPDTAIAAMSSFDRPEVLILGGSPKEVSFDGLAEYIKSEHQVAKILVIGEAKPLIVNSLNKYGVSNYQVSTATNMNQIVSEATDLALSIKKDDITPLVLLSPACASFDLFKNYKDRGEQFMRVVQSLAEDV
jgi:UDP-N-acetylmuramoylalanine--D-glutamate ligase